MANSKSLSLLGLATRARLTIDGEERLLKAFKNGEIKLVILASDAGENITKKIKDKCTTYSIPLIRDFTKTALASAIGKSRTVIGVTDEGFKNAILNALNH